MKRAFTAEKRLVEERTSLPILFSAGIFQPVPGQQAQPWQLTAPVHRPGRGGFRGRAGRS